MATELSNIINHWVPENSKVIDFGCGDGSFIKRTYRNQKYSWVWC